MTTLRMMILGGIAMAAAAAPVAAQHVTHIDTTRTTVTRTHGPLRILPHHGHKYCTTRYVHHRRVRTCRYH